MNAPGSRMEASQNMTETSEKNTVFRVTDLSQNQKTTFDLRPSKGANDALAPELGLIALRKLSFIGRISAVGTSDWDLKARLGATVVQPCVVTLEPVTTRVEIAIERQFLAVIPNYDDDDDEEIEIPEDENVDLLGNEIDITAIMQECLSLNLPLYPRTEGSSVDEKVFTEPGKKAMTDQDARPFAGLAGLRDKLTGDSEK